MEEKARRSQIQYENLRRAGRRYSAARRRIFHRFTTQSTSTQIPIPIPITKLNSIK